MSLPGTSTIEHLGSSIPEPLFSTKDALEKYQIVAQKLETLISKDTGEVEIQGVVAQIPEILLKCISRDEAALAVAQKVFKSLYENASNNLHVGAHLAILAAIRYVCKLVVKEVTSWVLHHFGWDDIPACGFGFGDADIIKVKYVKVDANFCRSKFWVH